MTIDYKVGGSAIGSRESLPALTNLKRFEEMIELIEKYTPPRKFWPKQQTKYVPEDETNRIFLSLK